MKKLRCLIASLGALISIAAFGATLVPVQLLNPTGSSSGQAIVSTGSSSAPAWGGIGVNGIASIAANTVLANATGSSASPTAFAMPSCTTALEWVSGTGFVCNTAGAFTTLSASSTITPSQTSGIVGTTTNNNANTGSVGEYLTNTTSGTSVTSGTPLNCTSESLTAGDWDVQAVIQFVPAGSTVVTSVITGASSTSATLGVLGSFSQVQGTLGTGNQEILASPVVRMNFTSTSTVYAVAQAAFSTSTMTCNGYIRARRPR
jgi:hypothetical protein